MGNILAQLKKTYNQPRENWCKMDRWISNVRSKDRISGVQRKNQLKWNTITWRNVNRIQNYNGLIILKEWKRVPDLVNIKSLWLVVLWQEKNTYTLIEVTWEVWTSRKSGTFYRQKCLAVIYKNHLIHACSMENTVVNTSN